MIAFSFTNLLETATLTASTQDAVYTVNGLRSPERIGNPYKATVATDTSILVNHGSAKAVGIAALIDCNFTTVWFQANATDAWGAPSYNQFITLTRSPNGRYQLGHQPAAVQTYQYNRVFIPTQTPTDGTSVFSIGGAHFGAVIAPTNDVLVDYDLEVHEPWIEVAPAHGGWRERSRMGFNLVKLTLRRLAAVSVTAPGVSDDLSGWLEIERQWSTVDFALVALTTRNPSWCWIMRRLQGSRWAAETYMADSNLELEEVT